MEMADGAWYKVTGIVTNRDLPGDELIRWYRQRCGKGEEVHSVLKEDLAGGRLPSGLFGVNAAWWAISVLAFNPNSAIKQLALGDRWVSKRLKAIRFGIINLPGRVVRHARRLIIRLPRGHPSFELLVDARRTTLAMANAPQSRFISSHISRSAVDARLSPERPVWVIAGSRLAMFASFIARAEDDRPMTAANLTISGFRRLILPNGRRQ